MFRGLSFLAALSILVTGCAPLPTTQSSQTTELVSVPVGLTSESLCGPPILALSEGALPGVEVSVEPDSGFIGCTATAEIGVVLVAVTNDLFDVTERREVYADLADGSSETCTGGASIPEIDAGLPDSAASICLTDDTSVFEYAAASPTGAVMLRVVRSIGSGVITADQAEQWSKATLAEIVSLAESPTTGEASIQEAPTVAGPVVVFPSTNPSGDVSECLVGTWIVENQELGPAQFGSTGDNSTGNGYILLAFDGVQEYWDNQFTVEIDAAVEVKRESSWTATFPYQVIEDQGYYLVETTGEAIGEGSTTTSGTTLGFDEIVSALGGDMAIKSCTPEQLTVLSPYLLNATFRRLG